MALARWFAVGKSQLHPIIQEHLIRYGIYRRRHASLQARLGENAPTAKWNYGAQEKVVSLGPHPAFLVLCASSFFVLVTGFVFLFFCVCLFFSGGVGVRVFFVVVVFKEILQDMVFLSKSPTGG